MVRGKSRADWVGEDNSNRQTEGEITPNERRGKWEENIPDVTRGKRGGGGGTERLSLPALRDRYFKCEGQMEAPLTLSLIAITYRYIYSVFIYYSYPPTLSVLFHSFIHSFIHSLSLSLSLSLSVFIR